MIAAKCLRSWWLKAPALAWSVAVIGSAGTGLFLGLDHNAHSDVSKFNALLAQHDRMPGEVIVKLSPAGKFALRSQSAVALLDASRFGIASVEAFETNEDFFLVKLAGDEQTAEFLNSSEQNGAIAYAEPNYIMHINGSPDADAEEVLPNDPELAKLWGLKNTGQKDPSGAVGVAGADIGAAKAWAITKGNKDIMVAVIDTGVDYTHPDLKDNIFHNPGESGDGKETNGIDDDGNGFVDDHTGWNFAGVSNNNPMDDNSHGTHVSGTIGARGDDGFGVVGVNWNASIMPVKFLTGSGSGTLADAVKSIQYSTLMNAKIMNNSWGGGGFTQSMFDAIVEAKNKDLLFIAAAGNDSTNADSNPHYPAGYQVDNVMAIAATTNKDTLATFSTYGKRTVHIAAPGHNVYSTVPKGKYASYSGTSMASPHAAGAAALLWGTDTSMTYAQVKDRLLRSRDYIATLSRKVSMSGRINVYNAISGIYPPSPEPTEGDWKDMTLEGPIETEHPYKNGTRQEWSVEAPAGAKFMRVVFSKVDIENRYDTLKIYDASGVESEVVTGAADNFVTSFVAGGKITLKFAADHTGNKWGFAVEKVQFVQ